MKDSRFSYVDHELYTQLGGAFFHCQSLQTLMVGYYATAHSGSIDWQATVNELFAAGTSRQIQAQLLKVVRDVEISESLQSQMEYVLLERLWLLHSFHFECGPSIFSDSLQPEVGERLEALIFQAQRLIEHLQDDLMQRQLKSAEKESDVLRITASIDNFLTARRMLVSS